MARVSVWWESDASLVSLCVWAEEITHMHPGIDGSACSEMQLQHAIHKPRTWMKFVSYGSQCSQ